LLTSLTAERSSRVGENPRPSTELQDWALFERFKGNAARNGVDSPQRLPKGIPPGKKELEKIIQKKTWQKNMVAKRRQLTVWIQISTRYPQKWEGKDSKKR